MSRVEAPAQSAAAISAPETGTILSSVVSFTAKAAPGDGLQFHVAAKHLRGDNTWRISCNLDPYGEASVLLHTMLLANGVVEVEMTLSDAAGTVHNRTCRQYAVVNQGGLAQRIKASLEKSGIGPLHKGPADSALYDYKDVTLLPWYERPDALDNLEKNNPFNEKDAAWLRDFVRNGYAVIENLLTDAEVAQINTCVDEAVANGWEGYKLYSSQRMHFLHREYEPVRRLWQHPEVLRRLGLIFRSKPVPCQTLTYVCGSEQDVHQDTIHLTPFPAGYMCGVWVALEDVKEGTGELFYYPGSHRLPRVYTHGNCAKVRGGNWEEFGRTVAARWQNMIGEHKLERQFFRPRKGTALIWHENLLHGGHKRQLTEATRRSIVSHYFANGSVIYYDSTGTVPPLEHYAYI